MPSLRHNSVHRSMSSSREGQIQPGVVQVSVLADLRFAALSPPQEKVANVWHRAAFELAILIDEDWASPPWRRQPPPYETIWGIPVRVDGKLPDGVVEFRSSVDGRLLARIVNVGMQINEMG